MGTTPRHRLLAEAVWPRLGAVWKSKETWAGSSEVAEDLLDVWDKAEALPCCALETGVGRDSDHTTGPQRQDMSEKTHWSVAARI